MSLLNKILGNPYVTVKQKAKDNSCFITELEMSNTYVIKKQGQGKSLCHDEMRACPSLYIISKQTVPHHACTSSETISPKTYAAIRAQLDCWSSPKPCNGHGPSDTTERMTGSVVAFLLSPPKPYNRQGPSDTAERMTGSVEAFLLSPLARLRPLLLSQYFSSSVTKLNSHASNIRFEIF